MGYAGERSHDLADRMNDMRDHPPDLEIRARGNVKRLVVAIVRHEDEFPSPFAEAFDGQFAIDHRDHHAIIRGFKRAVDDEEVSRMNPCTKHRIPADPDKEGRRRVLDEMRIEVEFAVEIVIGRRGKPG